MTSVREDFEHYMDYDYMEYTDLYLEKLTGIRTFQQFPKGDKCKISMFTMQPFDVTQIIVGFYCIIREGSQTDVRHFTPI